MSFVIYALIGLMPGDPIDLMRSADPRTSAADVARLKAIYGLDRPLVARYLAWAGAALAGDLGYSRLFAEPVLAALLPRLGNSLLLMGTSFVLAFSLALALGIAAARRPGSRLDAGGQSLLFRRHLDAELLAGVDPDPGVRGRARLAAGERHRHRRRRRCRRPRCGTSCCRSPP